MFEYIHGELKSKNESFAVIDVNGVGYAFTISATSYRELPALDMAVTLYVHLIHREDSFELIGFASERERALFRKLSSLSGLGPKQAIKFLSGMPLEQFIAAVVAGDTAALVTIPGLGKKKAEKIVFELNGKLDDLVTDEKLLVSDSAPIDPGLPQEAVSALEVLGFSLLASRAAVAAAIRELGEDVELRELIKAALRHV